MLTARFSALVLVFGVARSAHAQADSVPPNGAPTAPLPALPAAPDGAPPRQLAANEPVELAQLGPEPGVEPRPTTEAVSSDGGLDDSSAPQGQLHVVVFINGQLGSHSGIEVSAPGRPPVRTNTDGAARVQLGEGNQCISVGIPAKLRPGSEGGTLVHTICNVSIVEDESTEVLITLDPAGEKVLTVDRMAPGEAAAAREAAKKFQQDLATKPKGIVTGLLQSLDKQTPVAGARVFVRGVPVETTSSSDGRFRLELPEGTYQISVIHSRFATQSHSDVVVAGDKVTQLEMELVPSSAELADFVVTAPYIKGGVAALINERRESSSVTDVIGAEEMSRAGASTAAGALSRVTGINVVGGKFVFVRGMGDRYSATLLNGQLIPSPDPERRVVPLDLFPTQVLESVLIQKTFSPDMPAEFGGGMVQLRTRSYPEEATLQATAQLGYNSQTNLRDGFVYRGGGLDFLGTDDGTRALPDGVRNAGDLRRETRFEEGYDDEELQQFGRSMPNNWNVYRRTTPMDGKFTITAGDSYEIGNVPVGFLASGLYSSSFDRALTENRRYVVSSAAEGGLQLTDQLDVEGLQQTISSGGILAIGSEYAKGNEVKSTTLLLRVTDDRVDQVTGFDDNLGRQVRASRLRFIERQLLTEQLTGHHTLSGLSDAELDWSYAFAVANLDDPDRREYSYSGGGSIDAQGAPFELAGDPERIYTELADRVHNANLSWKQPFGVWSGLQANVKVGGLFMYRDRESDILRYRATRPGQRVRSETLGQQSPEAILVPENYAPDGVVLSNITDESDTYIADQRMLAGYVMTEAPITESVEVMAGARVERSEQSVTTTSRFNPDDPTDATLETTDVLPAATMTWRMNEEMALRGGFGRTVSRPEFRELADVPFYDVTSNTAFSGNPELERATIDNYDLRWEWYFSTNELFSIGGFYKTFDKPIEIIAEGGAGDAYTWANATSATNFGLELEGRRQLGFVADALSDAFVAFNIALIQSDVDLSGTFGRATSTARALQGQAPYVVNAQLGYDDTIEGGSGLVATLLYNVTGPWIAQVGVSGAPDIFAEPAHRIDFNASQQLGAGLRLSLKATNLLDPEQTRTQGDRVTQRTRSGRSISMGLSWSL